MHFTLKTFSRTPPLNMGVYTEPAQVYSMTTMCIVFSVLLPLK